MVEDSRWTMGRVASTFLLAIALPSCGSVSSIDADSGNASVDTSTCVDCFTLYDLHWGMDGGLVAYVDTSRLGPCHSYSRERSGGASGMPLLKCSNEVPGCPASTLSDISRLIGDPIVASSLQTHALYGGDSRPVDGQVFRFGVGNDFVDVGSDCAMGAAGCVEVPRPVRELVDLLQEVDRIQLAAAPCKTVFGM